MLPPLKPAPLLETRWKRDGNDNERANVSQPLPTRACFDLRAGCPFDTSSRTRAPAFSAGFCIDCPTIASCPIRLPLLPSPQNALQRRLNANAGHSGGFLGGGCKDARRSYFEHGVPKIVHFARPRIVHFARSCILHDPPPGKESFPEIFRAGFRLHPTLFTRTIEFHLSRKRVGSFFFINH